MGDHLHAETEIASFNEKGSPTELRNSSFSEADISFTDGISKSLYSGTGNIAFPGMGNSPHFGIGHPFYHGIGDHSLLGMGNPIKRNLSRSEMRYHLGKERKFYLMGEKKKRPYNPRKVAPLTEMEKSLFGDSIGIKNPSNEMDSYRREEGSSSKNSLSSLKETGHPSSSESSVGEIGNSSFGEISNSSFGEIGKKSLADMGISYNEILKKAGLVNPPKAKNSLYMNFDQGFDGDNMEKKPRKRPRKAYRSQEKKIRNHKYKFYCKVVSQDTTEVMGSSSKY